MSKIKNFMASLPLLASVLGDKYGVRVNIGGSSACTDGNIIYIPTLPLDCDEKLISQVRGFIDHESAHIRFTDFEAMVDANLNSTQKFLWNALEDWRIENEMIKIYQGCRINFLCLIRECFEKENAEVIERAGDNPALSILNYVLITVRAWDLTSLLTQKEEYAKIIQQNYAGLQDILDEILQRVHQQCHSTQDAIGFALELYEAIILYVPDDITKMENVEDAYPLLIGEELAKSIANNSVESFEAGLNVATEGHMQSTVFSASIQEDVLRYSRALRSRLHGLLQASVQRPCAIGRYGKLYTQKLYNVAVHNPRMFRKNTDKKEVSTAVHLLLDCSGSMKGIRMELASQACYGLALALEQCRGVNVGVTAFPASKALSTNTHNNEALLFPIVRHGQKVHSRFEMKASGCTPLAESLWWVMQQMYPLKENRKIILILTDGTPDSFSTTKHALNHAHKLGFEVLGLGIANNSLEILMPNTSCTIYDLDMLPTIMFGMLQKSLLKQ